MDNIEDTAIYMSLKEGIVRDMFPTITRLVHSKVNKKNMMLALDHYVKKVDSGITNTLKLVHDVAGIFSGVDYKELMQLIEKLIKVGKLDKRYAVI